MPPSHSKPHGVAPRDFYGQRGQGRVQRRQQGQYGPIRPPVVIPPRRPAGAADSGDSQPAADASAAPTAPLSSGGASDSSAPSAVPAGTSAAGDGAPSAVASGTSAAGNRAPSAVSSPTSPAADGAEMAAAVTADAGRVAAETADPGPAAEAPAAVERPSAPSAEPAPPFDGAAEGWPFEKLADIRASEQLPFGWTKVKLEDDRMYYFNSKAKVCCWHMPHVLDDSGIPVSSILVVAVQRG
ncbi:unnamed protein product [Symbiodinium sp. CCMP2592]|nr:unnamed protein product [Symbiodinium sp. CCMP2592]